MRIDSFGVKPTGFLAAWRYVDIYVDENGFITTQTPPGTEGFGRERISDYKHNSRIYSPGDVISRFCNYETFTHYTVIAQDERPFARVVDELNAPQCGYETPLPTPAVPFNPFGTPSYGERFYFTFCDIYGNNIRISIRKKNYSGVSTPIQHGSGTPFKVVPKEVDDSKDHLMQMEARFSVVQTENFQYSDFYSEDERMYQVEAKYTDTGQVFFKGYVLPDNSIEDFYSPPNEVSIKCTDGLTQLKEATYPIPLGGTTAPRQSFKDVLCYCFAPLNLNLNLTTICNLYASTNLTGLDDDPLAQNTINPNVLTNDKGEILTCYQVLEEVAKAWGAIIKQVNGEWCFVRQGELATGLVRMRRYNYQGLFLNAEQFGTLRKIGGATGG